MPAPESRTYQAEGDINKCRFVKHGSGDFTALQAADNEAPVGISQEGARNAPIPGASELAAANGQQLLVFVDGAECLLELGATVTPGQHLKADADGKGVPIAAAGTDMQYAGAQALAGGAAGEKVMVKVHRTHIRPALV